MKAQIEQINQIFSDCLPKKISLKEWSAKFRLLDTHFINSFYYYNNNDWGRYLFPPATFMVYGARQLRHLKFDNSLAALRLWGFSFNESERLFRAKQIGKKVIATMGDLGIVPIIVMAFPDCIPFYPECIWWTPFFSESNVLLDRASELGMPEASCFVRAALAAFDKKAYFPKPDLLFASTGASCDDYSCIMQMVEHLGHKLIWLEIPYRRAQAQHFPDEEYKVTTQGYQYPARLEKYLVDEYKKVWHSMIELTQVNDIALLELSIKKANRLRRLVEDIKKLVYNAEIAPFPALEMMVIEFGNLYGYADFDEWFSICEMVYETVQKRVERGIGVLSEKAIPIAWITPSADPILLNLVEDLGGRVITTEYVINQALVEIEEDINPFNALARSFLNASLIGSTDERVRRIKEKIEQGKIKGVIITNMLGASHCAMETKLIAQILNQISVLTIDVPAPTGITEQLKTRIAAFLETIKN
ncbi:MAG: 2-hydroxyacyl-CoA dehydratase family protein [candidate division WOR-3 bacterium]|nr:2-hydroxyacyl-CoA dehydratase family protein [candidate division WOR-3 bacterium]